MAWSLFNIGDGFVRLIVQGGNGLLDAITRRVRAWQARSPEKHRYLAKISDRTLRVTLLGIILLAVSPLGLMGPISSEGPSEAAQSSADPPDVFWQPLLYSDMDVRVDGRTYENTKYGFMVTFPDEWIIRSDASANMLVEAESATSTARVTAMEYVGRDVFVVDGIDYGITGAIGDGVLRDYMDAGWSILGMKPVLDTMVVGDTASDGAIVGLWSKGTNSVAGIVIFRNDSVYYVLEVFHPWEEDVYEHVVAIMQSILDSVRFE